jgi:hypothetical protein
MATSKLNQGGNLRKELVMDHGRTVELFARLQVVRRERDRRRTNRTEGKRSSLDSAHGMQAEEGTKSKTIRKIVEGADSILGKAKDGSGARGRKRKITSALQVTTKGLKQG